MALFGSINLPDRPDPENVRRLDLLQVPMVRDMMRFGLRISKEHFADLSFRLGERMKSLHKDITAEIPPAALDKLLELDDDDEDNAEGVEFNVQSSKKVAELLYDVLGLQHTKGVKVKKTKSGGISTGKKTLEQLKREHPVVAPMLEYKECAKLKSTYADSIPRKAKWHPCGDDCPLCGRKHWTDEWRSHTQIMTTRAATGRLATKNINHGNVPARTKAGAEIRAGFIASEGHVLSQRDWAQIELRLLADRSKDPIMIEVYKRNGDIHTETAMRTFNLPLEKIDKMLHRAPCKNVGFGVVYGLAAPGLLDLMAVTYATAGLPLPEHIDEKWCEDFIENYFKIYAAAKRFLDAEESSARRFAIAWTRCGRVRRIPEVRSYHAYVQAAGVRQAGNHVIQGYSADIMKLAMGELHARFKELREFDIEAYPLISIYDELLVEVPEEDGETVQAVMGDVMDNVLVDKKTGVLQCEVPIQSDGHLMTRWTK